jgi:pSer/pThr/pTyr-binding forkhead associated (FHA) protein
MGLQQFERRLERMVEGVFARAFRGGLQPVEIGRRLTREMDLGRTVAPKGTLVPNDFVVVVSPSDRARFASIEDELVDELIAVARDHADVERYSFVGRLSVVMETDDQLAPGVVLVSGEMQRHEETAQSRLLLPDGQTIQLGDQTVTMGRLPECTIVLSDPNVSRVHAEVRPVEGSWPTEYQIVDRGSTNGTRVNGMPLAGARVLVTGDTVTLGATSIGFERG